MEHLFKFDWSGLFLPKLSVVEIFVRGMVVYLCLCVLLRIIPKRQVGKGSISDLLFVVLIGGIAVEAIARQAESLPDFFFVLLTVLLVGFAFDWLAFRFHWVRWLLQEPPTCLIRDGRTVQENLRREMISEEDLKTQLRRQDIDDPREVKEAHLEADGEISVLKKRNGGAPGRPKTAPENDNVAAGLPASAEARDAAPAPPGHQLNGHSRDEGPVPFEGSQPEGQRQSSAQSENAEPELREFLAAAHRLQTKLNWHQQQVTRLRDALTRHGVRLKPFVAARQDTETKPEPPPTSPTFPHNKNTLPEQR